MIGRQWSVNVLADGMDWLSSVSKSAILSYIRVFVHCSLFFQEFSTFQIGSHLYKWVNQAAFLYSSSTLKSRIASTIWV